ncbi:hypothetical protein B0H19DRAFT_1101903 [Mycena capillaripes]|nr:hypothetical protein B0H19DRAFT_1101903 [Mycena capillaripes]
MPPIHSHLLKQAPPRVVGRLPPPNIQAADSPSFSPKGALPVSLSMKFVASRLSNRYFHYFMVLDVAGDVDVI